MSFNYHKEHFGEVWGLHNAAGEVLHTGCVAFGMDRLAVALFVTHGAKISGLAGQRARSAEALSGIAGIHRHHRAGDIAGAHRSSETTRRSATSSTSTSRFSALRAAILSRCSSVMLCGHLGFHEARRHGIDGDAQPAHFARQDCG